MKYTARRVHLDFHTSPLLENIGSAFDKADFQRKLKLGNVQSVTLFAKCHHGYTYYPSKVGVMHPHLNFDLLGEQIKAAHEIGVKAPIYITLGWSNVDVFAHKDWREWDFYTKKERNNFYDENADAEKAMPECCWINLCPTGEYLEHLKAITAEVCDRYAPVDGIFYDICFFGGNCVCPHCVEGMKKKGYNPLDENDVKKYYKEKRIEMMRELSALIHSKNKDATVFFNGSCISFDDDYLKFQTHYEVEELPTCGGDYDQLHLKAKRLEKYGKEIVGMTGKFQAGWGEFGGFKNPEALKMECATCLSLGAGVSIGDQLHPSGALDESTYKEIGYAFSYVKELEEYCLGSVSACDIAVVMSNDADADKGANMLLLESQIDYDIIDADADWTKYKCVVLPDAVEVDGRLAQKLKDYVSGGGKLIISGSSVKNTDLGIEYFEKSGADVSYLKPKFNVGVQSPLLVYDGAHIVRSALPVAAQLEEPYFNRTFGHYCSHKNTPNCGKTADYPAMLESENIIYFAHEIFREYALHGAYYIKQYVKYAFEKLCGERALRVDGLMSIGRARIRENKDIRAYCLHLFYCPAIKRGNVTVLEDFPTVNGVKVSYKTEKKIKEIICMPQNTAIDFTYENGEVSFRFDGLKGHQLLLMKY